MWACRWTSLVRAHGWAGQGCRELEVSPAVVSLGQRSDLSSWAMGRVGGAPGLGRNRQSWKSLRDRHIKRHMLVFKDTLDTILQTTVLRKPSKTIQD